MSNDLIELSNGQTEFDLLLETSWEVCNKIGGIYTVLSTKAATLQRLHKDKTIFIGPDVWTEEHPSPYFTESRTLLGKWRKNALLPEGIDVRIGRWDVPGKPIAVLVRFEAMYAQNNRLYGEMWERFGVDSLHAYGDYGEACAFSHAAGVVAQSLFEFYAAESNAAPRFIAHFDEWTTGMALLYTKLHCPHVATVFTTHATSIGRSICGNGKPLYDYLANYNGDQMAQELNMEAKHSLEKTAALQADCFTTVSEVTARECEQLLGRRPDVVTPNGFESNFVPTATKLKAAREEARKAMLTAATALTGTDFGEDTFIVATSGRCEYRNKGIDMFIDALNDVRHGKPARKVLAFIMVPAWVDKVRPDLVEAINDNSTHGLPDPVSTHSLHNYNDDPIVSRLHQVGFDNRVGAEVTCIYVPCYLNGNDGAFNLSYYGLMAGFDATVFPSYYEPWGYTPLESVAFGVPTVTTSLSGFGQWVLSNFENSFEVCGVRVEPRGDGNYHEVCQGIAADLLKLISESEKGLKAIGKAAKSTAKAAAWGKFIAAYQEAFAIALRRAREREQNK